MSMGNSISVKIGRFVPNKAGYAGSYEQCSDSERIKRKAESVKNTADSMLSDDGYALEGHEVKQDSKGTR